MMIGVSGSRRAQWLTRIALCVVLATAWAASGACATGLVSESSVKALNQGYAEQTFRARKDITNSYADGQQVMLKKGTKVKIWVEGRTEWFKVKAYHASESREVTRGKTIVYIFLADVEARLVAEGRDSGAQSLEYHVLREAIAKIRALIQ